MLLAILTSSYSLRERLSIDKYIIVHIYINQTLFLFIFITIDYFIKKRCILFAVMIKYKTAGCYYCLSS